MSRVLHGAVGAIVVLSACTPGAGDRRDSMIVRSGGDIVAAGSNVAVADSVPGDAMVAGGAVEFTGRAGGSYLGAGGNQGVGGRITGSAYVAGGTVRIEAQVDRNVAAAGGDVWLEEAGTVTRNAYLAGGHVLQEGTVLGHLRAVGGDVELNGRVGGDVDVAAGQLTIGPDARIEGSVSYRVREAQVQIDPAATIGGEVLALPVAEPSPLLGLFFRGLRYLAFLIVGAVVVALFPVTSREIADALRRRAPAAFGAGLLWLVVAPVAVCVAAVTLVGLPLALIGAALDVIFVYLAPIVPSIWLGEAFVAGRADRSPVPTFLLGGAVLGLLMLVPWVGLPVRILLVCAGLGGFALWVFAGRARTVVPG